VDRAPEVRISARYFDLKAFQGDTEDRRHQHYLELLIDVCWLRKSSSESTTSTVSSCTMGFFVLRPSALRFSRLFVSMKMSTSAAPLLLTPKQVNDLQTQSNSAISILDSTWFMPNSPRKAKDEFLAKRIPGAQYLDLDEVASPNQLGLKHMMPSPQSFAKACGM